MSLYDKFLDTGKKKLVVLIDPDKPTDEQVLATVRNANEAGVDFFLSEAVFSPPTVWSTA